MVNVLRDPRDLPGLREMSGFKKFLLRGNVVDLAVAVVIGTAFTAVVTSFSQSFLEPLIALLSGGGQFGGVLRIDGQDFTYGAFLSQVVSFLITAAVVYFLVVLPVRRLLDRLADAPVPAGPTELELLTEIRDLLRTERATGPAAEPPAAAPGGP